MMRSRAQSCRPHPWALSAVWATHGGGTRTWCQVIFAMYHTILGRSDPKRMMEKRDQSFVKPPCPLFPPIR